MNGPDPHRSGKYAPNWTTLPFGGFSGRGGLEELVRRATARVRAISDRVKQGEHGGTDDFSGSDRGR